MSVSIPKTFDRQGYNNLSLAKKVELKRYARVMTQTAIKMRQLMTDLQSWVGRAKDAVEDTPPYDRGARQ